MKISMDGSFLSDMTTSYWLFKLLNILRKNKDKELEIKINKDKHQWMDRWMDGRNESDQFDQFQVSFTKFKSMDSLLLSNPPLKGIWLEPFFSLTFLQLVSFYFTVGLKSIHWRQKVSSSSYHRTSCYYCYTVQW